MISWHFLWKWLFVLDSFVGSLENSQSGLETSSNKLCYLKLQTIFCCHISRVLQFESDHKIMKMQSKKEKKKIHQKLLSWFPNDAATNIKRDQLQSSGKTFFYTPVLNMESLQRKYYIQGIFMETWRYKQLSIKEHLLKTHSWSQQDTAVSFIWIYSRLINRH